MSATALQSLDLHGRPAPSDGEGMALEQPYNPYASPRDPDPPPPPPEPQPEGRALRIAGALTIASIFPTLLVNRNSALLGSLLNVLIGGALLAGRQEVRTIAVLRVSLGLVVVVGGALDRSQWGLAVVMLFVTGSPLLLLVGKPDRRRTTVGALLWLAGIVFGVLGTIVHQPR